MEKIKVVAADAREIFLLGLSSALKKAEDISLVALCRSEDEMLEGVKKYKPNIVLVDTELVKLSVDKIINKIKNDYPDIKIIINQRTFDNQNLSSLISLDVDGYVSDDIDPLHLIKDIRQVFSGPLPVSPWLGAQLLKEFRGSQLRKQDIQLSKREKEILTLILKGDSNKEISQKLYISENTVKAHIMDVMRKFEVNNRYKAAILAAKKGLIDFNLNE